MTPPHHRKDIQVLRGIAVLSVVLFHAKEDFFSAGYLGVDVFFVISGFVVTPLIIRIFNNQTTIRGILGNLLGFYRRRIYRLAPALGAVLAVSAIAIFLAGNLYDHGRFARQGIATLLLLGNIGAFRYSGNYFSPNPNPLVHTWSLSVEEQIYLLLPLIIILATRKKKHPVGKIVTTLLTILIISLTLFLFPQLLNFLNTHLGVHDVLTINFYSPFSRIWQFCLGGIIYHFAQKKSVGSQSSSLTFRLAMSASLIFLITPQIHLDTRVSSIIASTIAGCVIFYRSLLVLPNRIANILVWFGDRSYSIYLVHMPLIYIAKYSPLHLLESNRKFATALAVILSVILGHICFSKVEEKHRITPENATKRNYRLRRLVLVFILLPGFLFSLVAIASSHNYDAHQVSLRGCVDTGFDPVKCLWKSPQDKGLILIVGDSQAYGNADGIISAGNSLGYNVLASSTSGCPFLDVQTSGGGTVDCKDWQNQIMNFITSKRPNVVVIANRSNGYVNPESGWRSFLDFNGVPITSRTMALAFYKDSLKRTFENLANSGSRVILFQNIPEPAIVGGNSILTKILNQGNTLRVPLASLSVDNLVVASEADIAKSFSAVRLFDPTPLMCPQNECTIIEEGREVYRDNWHLSEYGSLKLASPIREFLAGVLNQ